MKKSYQLSVIRYPLKAALAAILIAAACAAFAGCTVNPDTGATELFGAIEISDATLDVAEAAADEAASAGGVVGVLGVVAGTAIALYRRKKTNRQGTKEKEELKA